MPSHPIKVSDLLHVRIRRRIILGSIYLFETFPQLWIDYGNIVKNPECVEEILRTSPKITRNVPRAIANYGCRELLGRALIGYKPSKSNPRALSYTFYPNFRTFPAIARYNTLPERIIASVDAIHWLELLIKESIKLLQGQFFTTFNIPNNLIVFPVYEEEASWHFGLRAWNQVWVLLKDWWPTSSIEFHLVMGVIRSVCTYMDLKSIPTKDLLDLAVKKASRSVIKYFNSNADLYLFKTIIDLYKDEGIEVKFSNGESYGLTTAHPYTDIYSTLDDSLPTVKRIPLDSDSTLYLSDKLIRLKKIKNGTKRSQI